ncbi:Inosine triphosphate pyrophosphatase [Astathelohania contejeani]|uniref:Inosine triphosphate pyrophosphatase n=1 Tax=Astathelohania contejeani TaxID=164912 RepID=A0ABQ7HZT5_9MICR|nr:Inosine triphosphate pyrophosphatase [Thelohania contejeani]
MKFYFATTNTKKFNEIQSLIQLPMTQLSLSIPEIQGSTEEIAINKAKAAFKHVDENSIVLVDDVSLELIGLNGFPGPYIKDFLKMGYDEIERVVAALGREAVAQCTLAICYINSAGVITSHAVAGRISGEIIKSNAECSKSMAFDRVFRPTGFLQTFAEMKFEEKNVISHRGIAVKKLIDLMDKLGLYDQIK